jgi:hypothetical protein
MGVARLGCTRQGALPGLLAPPWRGSPKLPGQRQGFGIGICQSALAARDKAIIRVLKARFSLAMDTWIAMHEDLRESPRCAVTLAALVVGLSAYRRRP